MALVHTLTPEDNAAAARATAGVVAQRIGNSLKERFEENIHKRNCRETDSDYSVKMSSRAIAAFVIHYLGKADDVQSAQGVCDSAEDGGIDGIFVNHTEKIVVVVQSKFNQSGNATWNTTDFLRFKTACEHLQECDFGRFDEILQASGADIAEALDSIDYRFKFVMAHTGKRGAAAEILIDMQQWQDELNAAAIVGNDTPDNDLPFQVHLVSAEDLTEWMRVQHSNSVDIEDVELEEYGKITTPYTAYYGIVGGDQIHEWWQQHSSDLFTKNIRNLLGKTDVNESIRDTAQNNPDKFWFFNNGVTVLVRDVRPYRRNNDRDRTRGRFNFTDVSIINGAQTVSSIGYVGESDPTQLSDIKVQIRFIHIPHGENEDIIDLITRANNHQNRVLGRDFASQHVEQLRLRDELAVEQYTYQLLRSSQAPTGEKFIDIDEALDGLACLTMNATTLATLKSARGKFFENLEGSQYRSVFNPTISGVKLINVVKHHRYIEQLIKTKLSETDQQTAKKRYGILTHANRVIAALLMGQVDNLRGATTLIELDSGSIDENFETLLSQLETLIDTHYPNAYLARLFSNATKITATIAYIKNGTIPSTE
ncbi:AIPR family protein [Vibrio parahaemolyticus]|uniref:AIPR family protein n=1 Tax=Vibrio parahaemolyticus TaxID=670 RepID=UPI002269EED3|nr:AIPR family protein [Vibrio parahaemolyticus]ELA9335924.1 AIPR family protein [Vibrio parahaemolyticus]MCX8905627.1 AIPR family protein [Vibrio parahaemolyticus]WLI84750.1 AIPR family protein [Vibrio parahaemolyticus]HCG5064957.1 AIPR family protein [Vibrio parahaemolyticus]HCG5068856.1 AIPR family protein [Vibrio parahaemolyticus]